MPYVIFPPDYPKINGSLIFTAGPIQGAPAAWHQQAQQFIDAANPKQWVASPKHAHGRGGVEYGAQVDWETFHLRRAANYGVILFWLAQEATHVCDRAYAQTTRFELAEWKIRHERDGVRLVVGIELGFSNERYIRRRFSQDCPEIPIYGNLADTCMAAVKLADY